MGGRGSFFALLGMRLHRIVQGDLRSPDLLVDNRPGALGKVSELLQMLGRRLALRRTPGGFHGCPVIPVKLDDGIPTRMFAAGVRGDVVLDVWPETRNTVRHQAVNSPRVGG